MLIIGIVLVLMEYNGGFMVSSACDVFSSWGVTWQINLIEIMSKTHYKRSVMVLIKKSNNS